MEQKTFLTPVIKAMLIFTVILLTGILLVVIGNPFKKALAPTPMPPAPSGVEGQINSIEISSDAKSILNADTKAVIFTIADTQKYLKNSGYFYNPDTFQTTNAKYEGDCFLDAALSNNKNRIVFSTGCLPGDLPQAWVGNYNFSSKKIYNYMCPPEGCSVPVFKFLIAGSGKNFVWSADDKTITYETALGLSGMTETRVIDSQTGEIVGKIFKSAYFGFEVQYPVGWFANGNIQAISTVKDGEWWPLGTLPNNQAKIVFELAGTNLVDKVINNEFDTATDKTIVSDSIIKLSGLSARQIIYTCKNCAEKHIPEIDKNIPGEEGRAIFFNHENEVLSLSLKYYKNDPKSDYYINTFNQIISTLKFINRN